MVVPFGEEHKWRCGSRTASNHVFYHVHAPIRGWGKLWRREVRQNNRCFEMRLSMSASRSRLRRYGRGGWRREGSGTDSCRALRRSRGRIHIRPRGSRHTSSKVVRYAMVRIGGEWARSRSPKLLRRSADFRTKRTRKGNSRKRELYSVPGGKAAGAIVGEV